MSEHLDHAGYTVGSGVRILRGYQVSEAGAELAPGDCGTIAAHEGSRLVVAFRANEEDHQVTVSPHQLIVISPAVLP